MFFSLKNTGYNFQPDAELENPRLTFHFGVGMLPPTKLQLMNKETRWTTKKLIKWWSSMKRILQVVECHSNPVYQRIYRSGKNYTDWSQEMLVKSTRMESTYTCSQKPNFYNQRTFPQSNCLYFKILGPETTVEDKKTAQTRSCEELFTLFESKEQVVLLSGWTPLSDVFVVRSSSFFLTRELQEQ